MKRFPFWMVVTSMILAVGSTMIIPGQIDRWAVIAIGVAVSLPFIILAIKKGMMKDGSERVPKHEVERTD